MKRLLVLALLNAGCFTAWNVGGPWACSDGGVCADGFTCDDGVCCKPDGEPRCPTLPFEGTCPFGSSPDTYFRDNDGDSAGALATGRVFCRAPVKEPWVKDSTDCDDADPATGPLASERCNARDDDCDNLVDEGLSVQTWFRDVDGDGFGEDCVACRFDACTQPMGYSARAGDCDPANAAVFPGAPERCNHLDDNCNGQLDDPPFVDVENPGSSGGATFDCDTGQAGTCRAGAMQCVFSAGTSQFEQTCVARVSPAVDVCGDSLDNDCSGVVDDRPGCGGPQDLLTSPGITFGAVAFDAGVGPVTLPSRCQKNRPGGDAMAWLNPSWIGTGGGLHLWFAEAPAGTWWDLTAAQSLVLPVNASFIGSGWDSTRLANPIVQLCGDDDAIYQRYTPDSARLTSGALTLVVPLRPAAGWTVTGAGFDLSHVRRIEVLAVPQANTTFTNRFRTDAGWFDP